MKNTTNAYLVLSVANIRAMLHAAELEQKVRGEPTRESVTIVLHDIAINYDESLQPQVASWSIVEAVNKLVVVYNEYLAEHGSWAAQNAASTTMNHSDAAI